MSEWKLVPVEPTPEMIDAGLRPIFVGNIAAVTYQRMLAAAPAAPAPDPDDDSTPCTVCGEPVRHGDRHRRCGESVMYPAIRALKEKIDE